MVGEWRLVDALSWIECIIDSLSSKPGYRRSGGLPVHFANLKEGQVNSDIIVRGMAAGRFSTEIHMLGSKSRKRPSESRIEFDVSGNEVRRFVFDHEAMAFR